ncbi:CRISPR-associated endonuclease Cas2 [Brevibacillus fluminis]|uniref:CRISPR-associated endonuclease Cas2 n=1 Tax=Brevibacillus fluminis TaxID=511487 RepID=UPI003F898AAB
MHLLVIYDVQEDKVRTRVAEACKDYGLCRVQKSAFKGELSNNRLQELYLRLHKILGVDVGNIQMYPLCEKDSKQVKEIENVPFN